MPLLEFNKFDARLKSGEPSGRYILAGEEEFLIRHSLKQLSASVVPDESFAVFNHMVYDGAEIDFAELTDAVKAPPMMSEFKLVEWRHADFSKMRESDLAALEELAEVQAEHSYTVLVFSAIAGSFDFGRLPKKPSNLLTRLGGSFDILRFERSTDRQLYAWLGRHFTAEGIKVTLPVVTAMVDRVGHSMDMLKCEVDKLCAYAKANKRDAVTVEDIVEVCSSLPENEDYAFDNAILERNRQKAFSALEEMKMKRVDPIAVFAMMQKKYNELFDIMLLLKQGLGKEDIAALLKMNPYKLGIILAASKKHTAERLGELLSELARMDVGLKSGGISGYTALEIFISKYI